MEASQLLPPAALFSTAFGMHARAAARLAPANGILNVFEMHRMDLQFLVVIVVIKELQKS